MFGIPKDLGAELFGTFALVFAITTAIAGSLALTESFGVLNLIVVAFTAGLTLVVLVNTLAQYSGAHFNPAVTIALWATGKFPTKKSVLYLVAQFAGGILASIVLWIIVQHGNLGATTAGPYGTVSAVLTEIIATAVFMFVILSATGKKADANHAGMTIGFFLLAAHLFAIPFSGASLNPARSLGPALFAGGKAMWQLWVYFVGPIVGAIIGAFLYKICDKK